MAVVIVRITSLRFLVALICTVTEVVVVVTNFPFQSMARGHNCQDFKHCEEVYGWPKPELAKWIVLLHETEQKLRKVDVDRNVSLKGDQSIGLDLVQ